MWIGSDIYTLTIMQYIVEGDDLSIYFCDHELIPELAMYGIGKIYRCRSLR